MAIAVSPRSTDVAVLVTIAVMHRPLARAIIILPMARCQISVSAAAIAIRPAVRRAIPAVPTAREPWRRVPSPLIGPAGEAATAPGRR